ncbi:hypothetical protein OK348_12920 [Flavobacterium sp. MXW15]|uniref:DUF6966 domain-containing protein n=1 Tax=Xanthomonas chitinilytica TaxID=2989819 RepID=A0ABT3JWG2_9XANT|nr:hypothetical protein [Xanthomonas sp. H13-6]MCW4455688.1 hypothetical protein [Flavobacterium sp. MXW15]MCW4472826.1 hypothetical protein [Xanthomonas sp. H13-6]
MERHQQLGRLEKHLEQLIAMLSLDPLCNWGRHFESCLATTRELLAHGFTQQQLNELSGSTMCVYGGAGSFNDYAPVTRIGSGGALELISGMEDVDTLAGKVYQSALALRVVG